MRRPPILLATSLSPAEEAAWREVLSRAMPDERVVAAEGCEERASVELAIVANPRPGALRDLPGLRWVQSLWAGLDGLAGDPTLPDVPVVRLVDPALAGAMAETAAAVVLWLHRDLDVYAAQQGRAVWRQHPPRLARDRRVAVLGLGEMGRASAALLARIGFDVRGWSRSGARLDGVQVHAGGEGLAAALGGAEILLNLLPLTAETRGILGAASFAHLAPGACVVNLGRGGHLIEADLLDALAAGRLRHAVLDVFGQEPLPAGHPFWRHPGVTVLPHVAACTNPDSAAAIVAAAVAEYRRSGRVPEGFDRRRGY